MSDPLDFIDDLKLRLLPSEGQRLLQQLAAPPRLIAHAVLVHDVACSLVEALMSHWPTLKLDPALVTLGAALHDIGKIAHPNELVEPGHHHELAGQTILLAEGFNLAAARFCITHAAWSSDASTLDDYLVALADTCWKGVRKAELEQQIITQIQTQFPEAPWETMLVVDSLIETLAADADIRLAWQAMFPVIHV